VPDRRRAVVDQDVDAQPQPVGLLLHCLGTPASAASAASTPSRRNDRLGRSRSTWPRWSSSLMPSCQAWWPAARAPWSTWHPPPPSNPCPTCRCTARARRSCSRSVRHNFFAVAGTREVGKRAAVGRPKTPEAVVRAALRALDRNRFMVTPGARERRTTRTEPTAATPHALLPGTPSGS
jgi:hypothetical protein